MKTTLVISAALVLNAWVMQAQQPACRSTVLVTALDQKARAPVDGLTAGDLKATMNGRELAIRSLLPLPAPRRYVFVLDRSGSMVGVRNFDSGAAYDLDRRMKEDVEELLSDIPSDNWVAFIAFSGGQSTRTEFASPLTARSELPSILSWKPLRGAGAHRTPLWANMEAALKMLSPHKTGDVIVAVSDGRDNMSKLSKNKIENDLLASGVPVLALLIANPYLPTMGGADDLRDFAGLADATGGAAAFSDPALDARFPMGAQLLFRPNQLIPLAIHQYELQVEAPSIQKPEKWQLRAQPDMSGGKLSLIFPRDLFSCTGTD